MKVDVFDLGEAPGNESRLVSMYGAIGVVFDLKDPLACDDFAAYWQMADLPCTISKMRLELFIDTELPFAFVWTIDCFVVCERFRLGRLLSYMCSVLLLGLTPCLQEFDIASGSALSLWP